MQNFCVILTDSTLLTGSKQTTVSDSWSFSKRRKSTAHSGVGYCVTMKRLGFVNDCKNAKHKTHGIFMVSLMIIIVNPHFLYVNILWRMHYRYCNSVDVGIPFFNKWTKMQTVFVNYQKKWKDFFQKYEVKRDINKVGLLKMAFNRFIIKSFIWATNFIQLIIKNIFKLWSKGN